MKGALRLEVDCLSKEVCPKMESRVVLTFSQKSTQQPGTADGTGCLKEWGMMANNKCIMENKKNKIW